MIEIQHLTYRYPGSETDVLKGISLSIDRGIMTAVMGANGSGKTTLIRCMNGLLRPGSGSVRVDNLDVLEPGHLYEIRRKVGMVFQNPDNQIVATTVEREIAFGMENLGLTVPVMQARVQSALTEFSLTHYRDTAPHLLSGGERQRLALAAVSVMEPDYLILDEPTSLLDPRAREEVFLTIQNRCSAGMGIVLVTQSAEEAMLCDRLIVLHQGTVHIDGRPRTVFEEIGVIHALGLQVPVAVELDAMIRTFQDAH